MGKRDDHKSRWAKSLDEAGLLDDIDDGWSLPEDIGAGVTIRVEGNTKSPEQLVVSSESEKKCDRDDETVPFAIPVPSESPAPAQDELDRQPREAAGAQASEESWDEPISARDPSEISAPSARAAVVLGMGKGAPRRQTSSLPPLASSRIEDTDLSHEGGLASMLEKSERASDRTTPSIGSSWNLNEPISHEPPEDETARVLRGAGGQSGGGGSRERLVNVGGTRISVTPEAPPVESEADFGEILDEPPVLRDDGDALSLDAAGEGQGPDDAMSIIEDGPEDVRKQMRERYDLGDYSGALESAEDILAADSDDPDPEAAEIRGACRDTLVQMYEARIGGFDRVPMLAIGMDEVLWRNLDPSSGFIISRVDGILTYDDIIDVSGLPRFETCRILARLIADGIIK